MSCCKYSAEVISNTKTSIENIFISDFMVNAPEKCVKVYLYGLYKCNTPDSIDNTVEDIARVFNFSVDDVISAFMYWEDLNLVQIITKKPFEVRFLPIKRATINLRKFNADKYSAFNAKAQELIEGRMIGPMEYQEYYYLIENKHIEPDALCMIIAYCVKLKGVNIASSYILTVAKNWIFDGVLTCEAVEERLLELDRSSDDVKAILKALGIRRGASEEEYGMYLTWTKELRLGQDIIIHLAKKAKSKGGGFARLDTLCNKCYLLKLESNREIDDYFNNLDNMYELAKSTCKALGLRYENLENILDTYITPWVNLGFENDAILKIANYCFKYSIRTLEGMNSKINQLYKLGLLTADNIDEYLIELAKYDDRIQEILNKLSLDRMVSSNDRTMYTVWVSTWQMTDELIDFATNKSVGMSMPMQYLNKLLSTFYSKKVTSIEEAEKCLNEKQSFSNSQSSKNATKGAKGTEYSKEKLNSLINNLFEVEI